MRFGVLNNQIDECKLYTFSNYIPQDKQAEMLVNRRNFFNCISLTLLKN